MQRLRLSVLVFLAFVLVFPEGGAAEDAAAGRPGVDAGLAAYDKGDFAVALEILEPLAKDGDARAQAALASLYEAGSGVPQSNAEAVRWYFAAATQGDTAAAGKLADIVARFPETLRQFLDAADRSRLRAEIEDRLASKVEELLGQTVGRKNVRAEVSADLDFTGAIRRLSASILVNGRYGTNDAGDFMYWPRSEAEMELLAVLVRGALGYDDARGDVIEVINMEFADPPEIDDPPLELFLGFNKDELLHIGEVVVLGLLILTFVVVPFSPVVFFLASPFIYFFSRKEGRDTDTLGFFPFSFVGLSYIPAIGVIFGIIGAVWGYRTKKKRGRHLAMFGLGGIAFNVFLFGGAYVLTVFFKPLVP